MSPQEQEIPTGSADSDFSVIGDPQSEAAVTRLFTDELSPLSEHPGTAGAPAAGLNVPERIDPYREDMYDATLALAMESLRVRQAYLERISPYKSEIPLKIEPWVRVFAMVHTGDTHLAHDHSDPDALGYAVEQAIDLDGVLVLHGNVIDNVSNKFISTNTIRVALDSDEQVRLANAILHPGLARHIVIGIGKNTCHEGWSEKMATHDVLPAIVDTETPLIFSGGQIILVDAETNQEIGVSEGYHNSGKGRTQQSPEGSARQRSQSVPDTHPSKPDEVVDGHMHQLVAAQDVHHNPITGEDVATALGEVGAAKGSKDNPDLFLVSRGVPPRLQPADAGQGLVTIWRRKEAGAKFTPYPVAGYDRAKRMYDAVTLWENAAAVGGALDGLRGVIYDSGHFPPPTVEQNEDESIVRPREPAVNSEGDAPIYKTLSLNVSTDLPIRFSAIGNIRMGTTSLERAKLTGILKDIENDPWSFYVATRRLLNQGVPMSDDRLDTLSQLADLLAVGKKSIMAVMMTDELQNKSWGKVIKKANGKVEKKTPDQILGSFDTWMHDAQEGTEQPAFVMGKLYPGDWLHYESPIAGTPLIFSETVLRLQLNSVPFTIYLRDKLGHLTSLINPYHGLTRISQIWGIEADALVGGHTEQIGWRTWMRPWGQLEVVVPGGFSEFVEKGISNRTDYPLGGQGLILIPGPKKALYSFASAADGKDLHEALWLQEGLRRLGVLDDIRGKLVSRNGSR